MQILPPQKNYINRQPAKLPYRSHHTESVGTSFPVLHPLRITVCHGLCVLCAGARSREYVLSIYLLRSNLDKL